MNKEELETADRKFTAEVARINQARAAIVIEIGAYKRGRSVGVAGRIKCPCCTEGQLSFSRAGSNGHIHAACSTKDCVRWME